MDLNAIFSQLVDFFTTDFGAMIGKFLSGLYQFLFPANAPGATDVPLPETMKPRG